MLTVTGGIAGRIRDTVISTLLTYPLDIIIVGG